MAVPEQTPYIEHTGNGSSKSFSLGFQCESKDHLIVLIDDIEPPIATWSLTEGNVVFTTAPAAGKKIIVQRNTPFGRAANYQSFNNSFRPQTVNIDFDRIWWKLQELGVGDWLLKLYVDRLHQQQEEKINNLKDYVDDRDDELRAYLMEEIRKQGVALDQLDEYYNYLMQRLAQIAVDKGWNASFVVDASGKTQQQINDSSIYSVGSVGEMLALSPGFQKRTVQVKATGAMYRYDAEKAGVNDGVYVQNGWVLIGYHDQLLAGTAGLKSDGTNEYTKLKALLDVAAVLKRPVNMCGLNIETSALTLAGDIKLVGTGSIKLVSGSLNPTLLNTAYNLIVDGEITFDQNKAGNAGGVIGAETHCTIKHSGDILELKGAKFKPSTSINVVCRAKKKAKLEGAEIDGGMVNFYAIPSASARVEILKGEYKNAHLYDNIQILNGADIVIEGVKSHDPTRSCIVISNSTAKARIYGNTVYGAKTDEANQGGWGIVASVNSQDSIVSMNVCYGNQRGPITIDTYPDAGGSVDNRIVVAGNICNAMYNGGYGTSGVVLNNAKHANVYGNIIFKAAQGMLGVDCDFSTVHGNTFIDCRDYFASFNTSHNVSFKDNILDGCPVTGAAAIRFIDCNRFYSGGNNIRNLTGAAGFIYRVSGNSKDWTIDDDDCIRTVAGSGYAFHILGAGNTGGRIRRNRFKGDGVKGWDWYIVSDNLAQLSTHENELDSAGTNYITSGANVTAGDDTVNGSRNVWPSEPSGFKSRIGQVAAIAGALKHWNGSAWA